MPPNQDIRWIQRFNHFKNAFSQLSDGVTLSRQRPLSKLESQGLIQAFEYTHELAWKTLKDFLESKGIQPIYGSRDTTREAFKAGLIQNGDTWMRMIESRNQTTHTYNEATVTEITSAIISTYLTELMALQTQLDTLQHTSQ